MYSNISTSFVCTTCPLGEIPVSDRSVCVRHYDRCDFGFFGPQCSPCPVCNNLTSYCLDGLSGNGTCACRTPRFTGSDCLSCGANYFGGNCSVFCSRASSCNNKGSCSSEGTCICDKGFKGSSCDLPDSEAATGVPDIPGGAVVGADASEGYTYGTTAASVASGPAFLFLVDAFQSIIRLSVLNIQFPVWYLKFVQGMGLMALSFPVPIPNVDLNNSFDIPSEDPNYDEDTNLRLFVVETRNTYEGILILTVCSAAFAFLVVSLLHGLALGAVLSFVKFRMRRMKKKGMIVVARPSQRVESSSSFRNAVSTKTAAGASKPSGPKNPLKHHPSGTHDNSSGVQHDAKSDAENPRLPYKMWIYFRAFYFGLFLASIYPMTIAVFVHFAVFVNIRPVFETVLACVIPVFYIVFTVFVVLPMLKRRPPPDLVHFHEKWDVLFQTFREEYWWGFMTEVFVFFFDGVVIAAGATYLMSSESQLSLILCASVLRSLFLLSRQPCKELKDNILRSGVACMDTFELLILYSVVGYSRGNAWMEKCTYIVAFCQLATVLIDLLFSIYEMVTSIFSFAMYIKKLLSDFMVLRKSQVRWKKVAASTALTFSALKAARSKAAASQQSDSSDQALSSSRVPRNKLPVVTPLRQALLVQSLQKSTTNEFPAAPTEVEAPQKRAEWQNHLSVMLDPGSGGRRNDFLPPLAAQSAVAPSPSFPNFQRNSSSSGNVRPAAAGFGSRNRIPALQTHVVSPNTD
eukprot:ANDGO_03544.mRNA.1 uncharacterized protein